MAALFGISLGGPQSMQSHTWNLYRQGMEFHILLDYNSLHLSFLAIMAFGGKSCNNIREVTFSPVLPQTTQCTFLRIKNCNSYLCY